MKKVEESLFTLKCTLYVLDRMWILPEFFIKCETSKTFHIRNRLLKLYFRPLGIRVWTTLFPNFLEWKSWVVLSGKKREYREIPGFHIFFSHMTLDILISMSVCSLLCKLGIIKIVGFGWFFGFLLLSSQDYFKNQVREKCIYNLKNIFIIKTNTDMSTQYQGFRYGFRRRNNQPKHISRNRRLNIFSFLKQWNKYYKFM